MKVPAVAMRVDPNGVPDDGRVAVRAEDGARQDGLLTAALRRGVL